MQIHEFLILGIIGGLSPGPITSLMLGEVFQNGFRRAIRVPLALIISNLIVGPTAIAVIWLGSDLAIFLKGVTLMGGILLIYLGIQEWRSLGQIDYRTATAPLRKALIVDMVNPHPYIIWLSVIAPTAVIAINQGKAVISMGIWVAFVTGLVGSKAIILLLADKIRPYLNPNTLKIVLRILASVLIFFGTRILTNLFI